MPYNEKSKNNLKRWDKGESGNPKGKPKGSLNVSTYLKKYLQQKVVKQIQDLDLVQQMAGGKKITNNEAIAIKLIHKAIFEGDMKAIIAIQDRMEGKPGQFIDITSDGEQITGFTFEVVPGVIRKDDDENDDDQKEFTELEQNAQKEIDDLYNVNNELIDEDDN